MVTSLICIKRHVGLQSLWFVFASKVVSLQFYWKLQTECFKWHHESLFTFELVGSYYQQCKVLLYILLWFSNNLIVIFINLNDKWESGIINSIPFISVCQEYYEKNKIKKP